MSLQYRQAGATVHPSIPVLPALLVYMQPAQLRLNGGNELVQRCGAVATSRTDRQASEAPRALRHTGLITLRGPGGKRPPVPAQRRRGKYHCRCPGLRLALGLRDENSSLGPPQVGEQGTAGQAALPLAALAVRPGRAHRHRHCLPHGACLQLGLHSRWSL